MENTKNIEQLIDMLKTKPARNVKVTFSVDFSRLDGDFYDDDNDELLNITPLPMHEDIQNLEDVKVVKQEYLLEIIKTAMELGRNGGVMEIEPIDNTSDD